MTYNPKTEGSTGPQIDGVRASYSFDGVIIERADSAVCLCGCNEMPSGKGRKFRMGHDARYRGTLIRAFINGARVGIWTGSTLLEHDADQLAADLDWCQYLETAKRREDRKLEDKVERANNRLVARATQPQVGDIKLIRVGRWEYTGQVVAIFDDGDTIDFRYVDKKGNTKRVRKLKGDLATGAADPVAETAP